MFWFKKPPKYVRNHKHKFLKDYTDQELFEELEDLETKDSAILAGFCAEILRRQLCKTDTHK